MSEDVPPPGARIRVLVDDELTAVVAPVLLLTPVEVDFLRGMLFYLELVMSLEPCAFQ